MRDYSYLLSPSNNVRKTIWELVKRYRLELNPEDFKNLEKRDPKIVIFKLAERILEREGRFEDISEMLKKDLAMNQQDAEKLARDIKDSVVPFAIKVQSEPEQEDDKEVNTPEIILEKIKGKSVPPPPPTKKPLPAGVKEPATKNVEENAKLMDEKAQEKPVAPKGPETKEQPPQPAQADKYRESLL